MSVVLGKNREFPVIIMLRADKILLKMNSNGQIKSKRLGIRLGGKFALMSRLIPCLLLLIWPLEFIFNKILPALNITMAGDSVLAQSRSHFHLFYLEATFIKTFNPAFCRQKRIRVQFKDCALMTLSHWSFPN